MTPAEGDPSDPRPGLDRNRRFIHATAVAIDGRALLIVGPSRSGKSRLATALIATSDPGRPVTLIGDDRVLLTRSGGRYTARPHPRTAGFIERRGLGLVAIAHIDRAPVAALVALGRQRCGAFALDAGTQNLPTLAIVECHDARETSARVLDWWATLRGPT